MNALLLAATCALSACSLVPDAAPMDASQDEFCAAFSASKVAFGPQEGPVPGWDKVRSALVTIHGIGTPTGSDEDARAAILRLSDIAFTNPDEGAARRQVNAYVEDHGNDVAAMIVHYTELCGASVKPVKPTKPIKPVRPKKGS